jgi:hypothetical protein
MSWLRLEPVGESPECSGQFVSRASLPGRSTSGPVLPEHGVRLGVAKLFGDSITRYLLVFGDHRLSPLTGPR